MSSTEVTVVENNEIISMSGAEELTEAIRSTTQMLHALIKKAHDERAWEAMGYRSWKEYVESEFDFSRARSYQLINQAKVIEAIENAVDAEVYITEKDARIIHKRLPEITERIEKEEIADLPLEEKEKHVEALLSEYKSDEAKAQQSEVDNNEDHHNDYHNEPNFADRKYSNPEYDEVQVFNDEYDESKPTKSSSKSKLNEDESFLLNSYRETLSIFDSLPAPEEMARLVARSGEQMEIELLLQDAEAWITAFKLSMK